MVSFVFFIFNFIFIISFSSSWSSSSPSLPFILSSSSTSSFSSPSLHLIIFCLYSSYSTSSSLNSLGYRIYSRTPCIRETLTILGLQSKVRYLPHSEIPCSVPHSLEARGAYLTLCTVPIPYLALPKHLPYPATVRTQVAAQTTGGESSQSHPTCTYKYLYSQEVAVGRFHCQAYPGSRPGNNTLVHNPTQLLRTRSHSRSYSDCHSQSLPCV